MGGGFSVWPTVTEEVGLRPAGADFFSERGVGPKIHPSFSLTEEAKPFRMAKPFEACNIPLIPVRPHG